ncbi:MAG TPA: dihydroorotate dehydrogenase-like protein [Nitrospinota bacterium]|nr:dihydroorotate dehydrogenase-like protein [Nitrospinota bacterium]
MANLETTYLGLKIKNPIVVGSSGLALDAEKALLCEKAGAGAVVIPSIFEEHISSDFQKDSNEQFYGISHPEAYDYFYSDKATRLGTRTYCDQIEKTKKAISIPLIASINCYSSSVWVDFAKDVANAGADAIELNISYLPVTQIMENPNIYLDELKKVVKKIVKGISIPVSIKLPPAEFFIGTLASTFENAGAKGLVLFNRFMVPEINLDEMKVTAGINFSRNGDSAPSKRFIALLCKRTECDLIGACGVHTSKDVISLISLGANAVQIVSAIYKNGYVIIQKISKEIEEWMDHKNFSTIEGFRGRLSTDPEKRNNPFGRFQYVRMFEEKTPLIAVHEIDS